MFVTLPGEVVTTARDLYLIAEFRTPDSGLRTPDSGLRTQDSGLRTQNSELRTQNSELPSTGLLSFTFGDVVERFNDEFSHFLFFFVSSTIFLHRAEEFLTDLHISAGPVAGKA